MTRPSDIDLLAELVSFDSTSARPSIPIIDRIADFLGTRTDLRLSRHPDESGHHANLVARIGPETAPDRAGLILAAHVDCVPANEPGWQSDPYHLTAKDDTLVGRGACDMKGFLAVAMNTMLDTCDLRAPLMLICTHSEEVGSIGAGQLATQLQDSRAVLPRSCIIGEPTSLHAVRMHKGHFKLRITLNGTSAHSGMPHLGVSTTEALPPILEALVMLRAELETERCEASKYFEPVPFVTLNIGTIHAGSAVNIIPDRAELQVGMRLLPGLQAEPYIERITRAVTDAAARTNLPNAPHIECIGDNPPLSTRAEAPINTALCSLLSQTETHAACFASDGGHLSRIGIDCVLCGPGDMSVAHKPNESVPIADLVKARALLGAAVARCCK